jgi:copper transport protein
VLLIPGAAGHAAQTSPRAVTIGLDWLHLATGSVWLGGLIGMIVLWLSTHPELRVRALFVTVPRFSSIAFFSVLLLLGTGIGETVLHMPILRALWQTTYGQVILVKAGLLAAAASLGGVNLLHAKPRLGTGETAPRAARILRRTVGGEAAILVGAVFAAAILSSLAPPPPALAEEGKAVASVGPGRVARTIQQGPYTLQVLVNPNQAAAPNTFTVRLTKNGKPVTGAQVNLGFAMLDMQMGSQEYTLKEIAPGVYSIPAPALVMVGHWGLTYTITPPGGQPFTVLVVDRAGG